MNIWMNIWILLLDDDFEPFTPGANAFRITVKSSGDVQSVLPYIEKEWAGKGSLPAALTKVWKTKDEWSLTLDNELREALKGIKFNDSNNVERLKLSKNLKDLKFVAKEVLLIQTHGMSRISTALETFSYKNCRQRSSSTS